MPRVLADGRTKFTILTTSPADPSAPTASELNAGIDLSSKVLAEGFTWTPADSDKVAEAALDDTANSNSLGRDNLSLGFTLWRYYLAGGGVDTSADAGFTAVKEKGTTLWGYVRKSDKLATEAWATGDEIILGAEFIVDTPQDPGAGGFLKMRIPCEPQSGWPHIVVDGTAGVPVITGVTPAGQSIGDPIIIWGVRFTGTTGVTIDGAAVTLYALDGDTRIAAVIPAGAVGASNVVVTNASGASAAYSYTVV